MKNRPLYVSNKPPQPPGFNPDVQIVVEFESVTGKTMVRSATGQPLNPLLMCSLLAGVVKHNIDLIIEQQSKAINNTPVAERTATNPPHNYVKSTLSEIKFGEDAPCSYCGFSKDAHVS